jgi:hypothetical protein
VLDKILKLDGVKGMKFSEKTHFPLQMALFSSESNESTKIELIKIAIQHGMSPDLAGLDRITPLMIALNMCLQSAAELLL